MRMGWSWKTATVGLIFRSLFKLKGINVTGTGKLVNLISNDVSKFEEFAVMAPFAFIAMLELLAILIILIFQLNIASAFAGIGMTILFIPVQVRVRVRVNAGFRIRVRVWFNPFLMNYKLTVTLFGMIVLFIFIPVLSC
jgi:ABC-type multidrug transport system fused ATPase/permease subunit